jgi:putative ABC transport system substrate-binding protein
MKRSKILPVIGYLGSESADLFANRVHAFRQGLGTMGFVEGHDVAIEYRWADGQYDRLPTLAAELVQKRVAVMVAQSGLSAAAAKPATTTIPIVFGVSGDPVELGIVASCGSNAMGRIKNYSKREILCST